VKTQGSKRKLTTILCADVAGYSRLMGADEEGTLSTLSTHRAVIDTLISKHAGRVFGSAGDSVIAEFPSTVEAVRCAVQIQRDLAARKASTSETLGMQFRIGINVGDVMVQGDDLFGDGVNVAARLEGLADPGGICVSGSVYDQIEDKLPLGYEPLGEQRLKNIAKPVRVYRVRERPTARPPAGPTIARSWRWVAVAVILVGCIGAVWGLYRHFLAPSEEVVSEQVPAAKRLEGTFIAVLPYVNRSEDPEQEYFSDGITEDLIAALGRFSDLSVIARDSVLRFKGETPNPEEIARELGIRYLLQGSVRRAGDRVRVTAQLIDATRGVHLWSERYDRELKDVFAVQDAITQHVAATLAIKLSQIEQDRALAKPPSVLQAYDYVLRGRAFLARQTRTANREARRMFQNAIELDPKYSAAYAALGWSQYLAVTRGWTEFLAEGLERTEELALTALRLDPWNDQGHQLLGWVYLYRQQYERAMSELERAIDINPSDANAHARQGAVLLYSGHPDDAIRALETALRFNPSMGGRALANLGMAYYFKERYDDSIGALERGVGQDPTYFPHAVLAAAYAQTGRAEDASREAAQVLRLWPFFEVGLFARQFRNPADSALIADGLHKAGLPE
jgi:TolB-like protein/class 3 adenylate cyclase/Flp pilus assembly protein TadD